MALLLPVLGAAAVAAYMLGARSPAAETPPAAPASLASTQTPAPIPETPTPPPPEPSPLPLPLPLLAPLGNPGDADEATARLLADRLRTGGPVGPPDLESAEGLYDRRPDETSRLLLAGVLMTAARGETHQRRYADAAAKLRRAASLLPGDIRPRRDLVAVFLAEGDWRAAEEAAREALALDPNDAGALEGLGWALFRQDRNREAADALRQAAERGGSPTALSLLERIRKSLADEQGMTEQALAHFHVRYDGGAHEDVGREILRALERHYATLVRALDFQPSVTIPVILFGQQQYYDASGAPAWSGGVYDNIDGRIRLPIGGLTTSLTPDLDGALVHEVTHAFVAERTRGTAPRDLHEGLAQYMEGKRTTSLLSADQLQALADNRVPGVTGFYLRALSFAEYLMDQRGQGGINDLLRLMGETGDVNEASRRVYGQDYRAVQRAWMNRLRLRHGT